MAELRSKREDPGAKAPAYVRELLRSFGRFERGERMSLHDRRGRVPVLVQRLDSDRYTVSFTPGSRMHGVLANDQNRFAPPRSLPPILDFRLADGEGGEHEIVRYAWSQGAFQLLDTLLLEGHAFDTFEFVELTWQLAQALRFLHGHGIVHGQWNARSVVALPEGEGLNRLSEHRFELLNTGVGFAEPAAVPDDYIERGYYPPELFVRQADLPDLGTLDLNGDVYCFAAFLKDLLQRACSTEELPRRATRLMGQLHEHAVRRGWRATAEATRQKELEILDHLYTARARTEYLIQEGLRQGDQRATAEVLAAKAETLHRQVVAYLRHLDEHGYEPFDAFAGEGGDGLLHYTTFSVTLQPTRVHGLEDSRIEIRGRDLPGDLVRVTLNEHSEGVHVAEAGAGRILLALDAGLPGGQYAVSINNRRTNATLEVVTTLWLEADEHALHLPWPGCDELELVVRGRRLPRDVPWSLCPVAEEPLGPTAAEGERIVNLLAVGGERDGGGRGDEIRPDAEAEDGAASARERDPEHPVERVRLRVPRDLPPGRYQLRANYRPTPIHYEILPALPDPVVDDDGLEPASIRNHRPQTVTLTGRELHPDMLVDFGEHAPRPEVEVLSPTEARLTLPVGFPAGDHVLRVNRAGTGAALRVEAPRWLDPGPRTLRFARGQSEPLAFAVAGTALPDPEVGVDGYRLVDARGRAADDAIVAAEPIDADDLPAGVTDVHRLAVAASARGGARELQFAGRPTGIELRLKKPVPRAVQLVAAVGLVSLLTFAGFAVFEHLRPEISELRTASVFGIRPGAVEVVGRNVDAIELWPVDSDAPAASLPAAEGEPGVFRVELPEVLAAGAYALRPVGPVDSELSQHVLTVKDARLRVEPRVAHRFEDTVLRLAAADGFDPTGFASVELVPADGARAARSLPIDGGRFVLRAGELDAAAVGSYAVRLDSLPIDGVRVEIRGPRLVDPPRRPLIPGVGGRLQLPLGIADRGVAQWTGLLAADGGEVVALEPVVTSRTARPAEAAASRRDVDADGAVEVATFVAAAVAPGRYRVAVGLDAAGAEAIGPVLEVLPRPRVASIEPARIAPGRPARVVVDGVHLSAVDALAVRRLDAAATEAPDVLAFDPALVTPLDDTAVTEAPSGFAQRIEVTVELPSGRYEISPRGHADAGAVELAVFDDCERILTAYRRGEIGPEALLGCVGSERPSDAVLRAAADLLFDRGRFAEAAALYDGRVDAKGRFRRAFAAAFALDEPVEAMPAEALRDAPGYAAAAAALGWTIGGARVAWPDETSTWEVTFARARDERDPVAATSLLLRAEAQRAEAAAPVPPPPFAPFEQLRADARFREIVASVPVDAAAAAARMRTQLVSLDELWQALVPAQRAEALFWIGHAAELYDGDTAAARASLRRAAEGVGRAVPWARAYLAALGDDVGADVRDASWPALFAAVLGEFRHVRDNPNYDLLADPGRRDTALDSATLARARALATRIERLAAAEPLDPFAHHALLYGIRAAQAATWPQEYDGTAAARSRQALESLPIADSLRSHRRFYLASADIEPLTLAQIVVLPREELRERIGELERLGQDSLLPEPLRTRASDLARRLSLPSVVWGSHTQQKNP